MHLLRWCLPLPPPVIRFSVESWIASGGKVMLLVIFVSSGIAMVGCDDTKLFVVHRWRDRSRYLHCCGQPRKQTNLCKREYRTVDVAQSWESSNPGSMSPRLTSWSTRRYSPG